MAKTVYFVGVEGYVEHSNNNFMSSQAFDHQVRNHLLNSGRRLLRLDHDYGKRIRDKQNIDFNNSKTLIIEPEYHIFLLVLAYTYAVLQQVPWVEH